MLTKKYYEMIAAEIRAAMPSGNHARDIGGYLALERLARYLASTFESQNPKFDRARFLAACGVSAS